jgi:hypothetical protein
MLSGNNQLCPLESRDVEATSELLWPLSWALGFGRGSHSSFVPAPRSPPTSLQGSDCIPPYNYSLLKHFDLYPTSQHSHHNRHHVG